MARPLPRLVGMMLISPLSIILIYDNGMIIPLLSSSTHLMDMYFVVSVVPRLRLPPNRICMFTIGR